MSVTSYISLGSNLDDPQKQLKMAFESLAHLPETELVNRSSLYRSEAMTLPGSSPQPDYINAVAAIMTNLEPLALLGELQEIENHQGRIRTERWGPRTLDLDILLYGDAAIDSDVLKVPHPGLCQRSFVVLPLLEIAPNLVLPDGTVLKEIADESRWDDLELLKP